MEKTTKKKKSKKGLRKRIGIIAVGGLSLVLTVCLSVGATLAWFAGSTWASKSLYMGGPVYVEMAGRGHSGSTGGTEGDEAKWIGGDGSLDIEAAATRTTGSAALTEETKKNTDPKDILLPGQKIQIYSQARVYSTAETTTVGDDAIVNSSSGANTINTSNGVATYRNSTGRVTTTTTSVLRARFSIEVEFDPGVGFNNFTDAEYMKGYPKQSTDGTGIGYAQADASGTYPADVTWQKALGATFSTTNSSAAGTTAGADVKIKYDGRRDAVGNDAPTGENTVTPWTDSMEAAACKNIREGKQKSIYKWKYVSASEYYRAGKALDSDTDNNTSSGAEADGHAKYGIRMAAPFDGSGTDSAIPYYGVWVTEKGSEGAYKQSESDAFFKARCNAYLNTYQETYVNEYGNIVTRTVGSSVKALEDTLNEYFVKLVNDSSDHIHEGKVAGFTVSKEDGQVTRKDGEAVKASWLYIDPSIGNDTNTDEISTSVGGWWYLVADDGKDVGSKGDGDNKIRTTKDSVENPSEAAATAKNTITTEEVATASLSRKDKDSKSKDRLDALLYEITPDIRLDEVVAKNGTNNDVKKIVSDSFPFVNGSFALPSDALTNVFANAKITFKIAFQAVQAFFPFTESIDRVEYTSALLGTAKALSIKNAIPVFNEAFDYQENNGGSISGL